MPSLPKKKLSQQPLLSAVPAGFQFIGLLTPQDQADPELRNVRATAAAVGELLGANRPANFLRGVAKYCRYLTNDQLEAAGDDTDALENLPAGVWCLYLEGLCEFHPSGDQRVTVVPIYDPAGTGFLVGRTGAFKDYVPARLVRKDDPAVFAPAYAQFMPAYAAGPPATGHAFNTGDFMRSYAGGSAENFYKFIGTPGPAPDVTSVGGDANWELSSGSAVPITSRPAFENIVGDPRDNPQLVDFVAGKADLVTGKVPTTQLPAATGAAAGIGKLYTATGTSTDGAMTQKAVTDILSGAGLYSLPGEIPDPAQTGSGPTRGFQPVVGSAYFFSAAGTARLFTPTTLVVGAAAISVRLSAAATAPLLLYSGVGTGNLTTVQPGEIVAMNVLPPSLAASDPAGTGAKYQLITRSGTDPYAVPAAVITDVVAGTFSATGSNFGEMTSPVTPAGSVRGMRFKKGQAKYEFMPSDAGTADVWVRSPVA